MRHRNQFGLSLLLLALVASGCQGGSHTPSSSLDPTTAPIDTSLSTPTTELALPNRLAGQDVLGAYMLTITRDPLTVEAAPIGRRSQAIGDVVDLDLGALADTLGLFGPDTFAVQSFGFTPEGFLDVAIRHSHPFPAPNLAGPIDPVAKRADVGYTARALFLFDVPSADGHTFFPNDPTPIVADTEHLVNADGYLHLQRNPDLAGSSTIGTFDPNSLANTYPFELIVDEALDNRVGVSNGGSPIGNYAPLAGGWQRSNIGVNNDGWTGFDYLHAGQSATFHAIFDLDLGEVIEVPVVLLAKATQPKHPTAPNDGQFSFRVPTVESPVGSGIGADPRCLDFGTHCGETGLLDHYFAYRMPHAALDVSKIDIPALPVWPVSAGTSMSFVFQVRDWDAQALWAAPGTTLDDPTTPGVVENAISTVAPNTSTDGGNQFIFPFVEVSIPTLDVVSSTTMSGGNSGQSDDPLQAVCTLSTVSTPTDGLHRGLMRVTDPEDGLDLSAVYGSTAVIPNSNPVGVDSARTQEAVTYQAFALEVFDPCDIDVLDILPHNPVGNPGDSVTFSVVTDPPMGTEWSVLWDFDFGSGTTPFQSTDPSPVVTLGAPGTWGLSLTFTREGCDPVTFFSSYVISDPCPPIALLDIKTDSPEIAGLPGQSVPFTLETDPPLDPSWLIGWNFTCDPPPAGPGTTPCAVPNDPTPTVTLGDTGIWPMTVTITRPGCPPLTFPSTYEIATCPQIDSVVPTGPVGTVGEEVVFQALVTGFGDPSTFTWDWQFGAGTNPSSSLEQSPTVTLVQSGSFTGMVTMTAFDCPPVSFPFSYTVEDCLPPPTWTANTLAQGDLSCPGDIGAEPHVAVIPANGAGFRAGDLAVISIDHAADFDAGCELNHPSVELRIFDPEGITADLVVGFDEGFTEAAGGHFNPRVVATPGGITVSYIFAAGPGDTTIRTAFSPYPVTGSSFSPTVAVGNRPNDFEVTARANGEIAFVHDRLTELRVSFDQEATFGTNVQDGIPETLSTNFFGLGIAEESDRLEVCYSIEGGLGRDLRFSKADATDPSGSWSSPHSIQTNLTGAGTSCDMTVLAGSPVIASLWFNTPGQNPDLVVSAAGSADPMDALDWTNLELENHLTGGDHLIARPTILVADGRLAVSYFNATNGDLTIARACVVAALSIADWQFQSAMTTAENPHLAIRPGNLPPIAGADDQFMLVFRDAAQNELLEAQSNSAW